MQISLVQAGSSLLLSVRSSDHHMVLRLAGNTNWWQCDYRARTSEPEGCSEVI